MEGRYRNPINDVNELRGTVLEQFQYYANVARASYRAKAARRGVVTYTVIDIHLLYPIHSHTHSYQFVYNSNDEKQFD